MKIYVDIDETIKEHREAVLNFLKETNNYYNTLEINLEVDNKKIFENDDDVGGIFKSILKIQNILNEFNIRKFN